MLAFTISWMVVALVGVVNARPAPLENRDVVAPPITYPTAGTVWKSGQKQHVDWDTSKLPPYQNITNKVGIIVIGYLDDCDPEGGEHLDLDNPLAKGFNISAGAVDVTVPTVKPRNDYILVLFGDSGNLSPKFAINVAITGHQSDSAISSACSASSTTSSRASSPSSSSSAPAAPTTTKGHSSSTGTSTAPGASVTVTTVISASTITLSSSTSKTSLTSSVISLQTVTSLSTSFTPASSSSESFFSFSTTSPLQFGTLSNSGSSASPTTKTNAAAALRSLEYGTAAIAALVAAMVLL